MELFIGQMITVLRNHMFQVLDERQVKHFLVQAEENMKMPIWK